MVSGSACDVGTSAMPANLRGAASGVDHAAARANGTFVPAPEPGSSARWSHPPASTGKTSPKRAVTTMHVPGIMRRTPVYRAISAWARRPARDHLPGVLRGDVHWHRRGHLR